MNQQEKIEILATKVVGWVDYNKYYWLGPSNDNPHRNLIRKIHDNFSYGSWNPYESISDAMIILDKLNERYLYQIRNGIDGKYYITLQEKYVGYRDSYEDCVSIKESRSIQEAICEAALKTLV